MVRLISSLVCVAALCVGAHATQSYTRPDPSSDDYYKVIAFAVVAVIGAVVFFVTRKCTGVSSDLASVENGGDDVNLEKEEELNGYEATMAAGTV